MISNHSSEDAVSSTFAVVFLLIAGENYKCLHLGEDLHFDQVTWL